MKVKIFIFTFLISFISVFDNAFAFDTSNIDVSSFIDPITGVYGYQMPSLPDTILGDTVYQYYTIVFNTTIERAFLYGHDVPFTVKRDSDTILRTSSVRHSYIQYYCDFSAGSDSSKWTFLSQQTVTDYWRIFSSVDSKMYPPYCNYDMISWHDSTTVIFEACELNQKRLNDGFHTDDDSVPTPSPEEPTSPPESSEDGGLLDALTNLPGKIVESIKSLFDLIIDAINGLIDKIKDLLIYLFVPKETFLELILNTIERKFYIFYQIFDLLSSFMTADISDEAPTFSIVLYGKRIPTLDTSILEDYIVYIRNFIGFFAIFGFSRWLLVNIPNIVMGQGLAEKDFENNSKNVKYYGYKG